MTVQFRADPGSSLPDLSFWSGMKLNDDLDNDPFHSIGAKSIEPFGYYAAVQPRTTKYTERHIWETMQKKVPYIIMDGNTVAAFSISNIESSTLPTKIDEELRTTLISALKIVEVNLDINFENSDAFYEFNSILMNYGENLILCLQDLITGNELDSIFAGRLLRHLGYMANDYPTKLITWLLEYFLISKKIPIRNGAVLGLANLNNPETVPSLKKALKAEQIPEIKRDIQRTLERLIKTGKWLNT